MMRLFKLAFLILFESLIFSCFAQKEIVKIDFPYRTMQNFDFSKNQNGEYCLFVNKEEFYYFCYISKEGEKIYDTTIRVTSSSKSNFLGVKPGTDQFNYYFLPIYSKKQLITISITKENRNCSTPSIVDFTSEKGEKIVRGITIETDFYLVSASKKTSSIYVSNFKDEINFDKKVYPITIDEKILKRYPTLSVPIVIKKLFSRRFRESGYKMLNPIHTQIYNNRLYIDNSNLHFTFNDGDVISILQDSGKLYYNFFYDDVPFHPKDFSSFVINDKLFRVIVNPKELFFKIYDIKSGMLDKEYHYTIEEEFDLIYAPFVKYINTSNSKDVTDVNVTVKELFKDLSRGNIAFYGFTSKENNLHFFIGSNLADQAIAKPIRIPAATPTALVLPVATFNSPSGNFVSTETILSIPEYNIIHAKDSTDYYCSPKVKIWPDTNNQDSESFKVKFSESNQYLYVLQLFNDKKQLVITEFEK